jgi:hypothetical protein
MLMDSYLDPLAILDDEKEYAASSDVIALPPFPNLCLTSCGEDLP